MSVFGSGGNRQFFCCGGKVFITTGKKSSSRLSGGLCCCVSFWFWRKIGFVFLFWQEIVFGVTYVLSVQYSCAVVSFILLLRESFITTRKKKFKSSVWRVVLLCQFLVLAGNRLWMYILLCTWSTI